MEIDIVSTVQFNGCLKYSAQQLVVPKLRIISGLEVGVHGKNDVEGRILVRIFTFHHPIEDEMIYTAFGSREDPCSFIKPASHIQMNEIKYNFIASPVKFLRIRCLAYVKVDLTAAAATGDSFFYSLWVEIWLFKCTINGIGLQGIRTIGGNEVETIQSVAQ